VAAHVLALIIRLRLTSEGHGDLSL
jgi:hypothetical protein